MKWKKKYEKRERRWEKSTGQWIWMRDSNLDKLKIFILAWDNMENKRENKFEILLLLPDMEKNK